MDVTGSGDLGPDLAPGDARFRLLRVLASDFFRPFRSGTLFQLVFPEEHYNPLSSPPRVRMLVMRLRLALKAQKFSVSLSREEDGYQMIPACPVHVNLGPLAQTRTEGLAERLRAAVGEKSFSVSDGVKALAIPQRTLSRAIADAVTKGEIERTGKGKATAYRFRK